MIVSNQMNKSAILEKNFTGKSHEVKPSASCNAIFLKLHSHPCDL